MPLLFANPEDMFSRIVSNGLDPDQELHIVGPNLGPNCLQRLSAVDKNRC